MGITWRQRWATVFTLAAFFAAPATAQEPGAVAGVVRDSVTERPLIGAIVTLRPQTGAARSTRTDEGGAFLFARVPTGSYSLAVQRLGYEPSLRRLDVAGVVEPVIIALSRMTQLDTVRVRAARQAIYGAVARAADMVPITEAYVQILGSSATNRIRVDSSGHFFIPVRTAGPYVVRATAKHYTANTVSITVPPNDGAEVAMLLDTAGAANNRLEMAFSDFRDRMIRAGSYAAVVPRSEVTRNVEADLLTALQLSPSFILRNLRFGETACVFVDGRARVGMSVKGIDPADVEAVEVYSATSERSGTLSRQWPRNTPCAETGIGRVAPGSDVVQWVAIWLKH